MTAYINSLLTLFPYSGGVQYNNRFDMLGGRAMGGVSNFKGLVSKVHRKKLAQTRYNGSRLLSTSLIVRAHR